ncbi:flagellar hook-length control protein FliK [Psychrosphaera haliotis]|nr:flagellar hook-length control protein FliK [Psychrosphaera haliotis]
MLQQHRILPEPLPTKSVEKEVSVRKSQYESENSNYRRDFDTTLAANNRRQEQRRNDDVASQQRADYDRQLEKKQLQRTQNERQTPARQSQSADSNRTQLDETRQPTTQDRPAKEYVNNADRKELESSVKSLKENELSEPVLKELTDKYSGAELLQKVRELLASLSESSSDADSSDVIEAVDEFASLLTSSLKSANELNSLLSNIKNEFPESAIDDFKVKLSSLLEQLSNLEIGVENTMNENSAASTDGSELLEELGDLLKSLLLPDSSVVNENKNNLNSSDTDSSQGTKDLDTKKLDWLNGLLNQNSNNQATDSDIKNAQHTQGETEVDLTSSIVSSPESNKVGAEDSSNARSLAVDFKNSDSNKDINSYMQMELSRLAQIQAELNSKGAVGTNSASAEAFSKVNSELTKLININNPVKLNINNVINSNLVGSTNNESANTSEFKLDTGSVKVATELEMLNKLSFDKSNLFNQLDSGNLTQLSSQVISDGKPRAEVVDILGVQLDKTLQAPKLENIAQAKSELMIKENILFNKQELASNIQQQVGLMMARNMKSIDIRLDPPELGSMQIKLHLGAENASVSFVVASQQAKDALEGSIPKLRELLEQQGLQLADSNVKKDNSSGQNNANGDEQSDSNGLVSANSNDNNELSEDEHNAPSLGTNYNVKSPWQVDYYA